LYFQLRNYKGFFLNEYTFIDSNDFNK